MPLYKAEGIVLRRQPLGEADRVVTLLTREYGKLRAAARGVRRTTSRLGARVEPFTRGRFLLAKGKSLDVITQVDVAEAFGGLRAGLHRTAYASFVAELVDRFLPERDRHETVFTLLAATLAALAEADEEDAELLALWFALRLAAELGYRPETESCVGCGRALLRPAGGQGRPWWFSPALGGALCQACASRDPDAVRVPPGVLAMSGALLRLSAERLPRLRISPDDRRDLARLVQAHLEYRLEEKLRAPFVIGRLRLATTSPKMVR
jgi:DNA repair protein RecO (recombination protein O)